MSKLHASPTPAQTSRAALQRRFFSPERLAGGASLALACALAGLAQPASAQSGEASVVKFPQDVVYHGAPGTPQHATLIGDSSKPGLYVDRIKYTAGTKTMPHTHPDPARTVLIMSGTFYFAVGETWDESKLKAYPAGTIYSEPPNTPHYGWAKDGDVLLQVTAIGPTGNIPVKAK